MALTDHIFVVDRSQSISSRISLESNGVSGKVTRMVPVLLLDMIPLKRSSDEFNWMKELNSTVQL